MGQDQSCPPPGGVSCCPTSPPPHHQAQKEGVEQGGPCCPPLGATNMSWGGEQEGAHHSARPQACTKSTITAHQPHEQGPERKAQNCFQKQEPGRISAARARHHTEIAESLMEAAFCQPLQEGAGCGSSPSCCQQLHASTTFTSSSNTCTPALTPFAPRLFPRSSFPKLSQQAAKHARSKSHSNPHCSQGD